ncbi:MAG: hypothetical protein M1821_006417 [Bathelium mastoideum]|nr:MAG: hypothetical protein M1821_006417 [Bathelium mastoideum]KAI9693694.1 MAG: hypothetical protein M1822_002965 [Bathelium mastoideum]
MSTFEKAAEVRQLSSHTYAADFPEDWCIGSVPHGGYITAVFLRVARTHFATTLRAQSQPHPLTCHLEFLRRTQVGPATFTVADVKLGRQTSVIHATLRQQGRDEVVGYVGHTDLRRETGISLPTAWALQPPAVPVGEGSLARLKAGEEEEDEGWAELEKMPFAEFRKASNRVRFFFPRRGQLAKGLTDEWMCLRSGERWTNDSIGFAMDMWPQIIETYSPEGDPYEIEKRGNERPSLGSMWYPTLLLNLDIKKVLPEEGVDFLFQRIQAKRIQNGRFDLESILMDEEGDIIALSHHVVFAVSAARNLAKRSDGSRQSKM